MDDNKPPTTPQPPKVKRPRPSESGTKRLQQWKYTATPLSEEELKKNGRIQGRELISWNRPNMWEKAFLHLAFQVQKQGHEVPWQATAHALFPGMSGDALQQSCERLRSRCIAQGHLVPPKFGAQLGSQGQELRGVVRHNTDPKVGDFWTTRAVPYEEPMLDRTAVLPDAHLYRNNMASRKNFMPLRMIETDAEGGQHEQVCESEGEEVDQDDDDDDEAIVAYRPVASSSSLDHKAANAPGPSHKRKLDESEIADESMAKIMKTGPDTESSTKYAPVVLMHAQFPPDYARKYLANHRAKQYGNGGRSSKGNSFSESGDPNKFWASDSVPRAIYSSLTTLEEQQDEEHVNFADYLNFDGDE